jgi:hypothetical protein
LSIAGCWLLIEKTRTGFLLEFTPDLFRCRNDKLKQRCKQEMSFPRKRESINLKERVATARLSIGATLCGRPNI